MTRFFRRFAREHHPRQERRCWWLSLLLGVRVDGGSHWHVDGTNHWWECNRCGEGDSSL